MGSAQKPVLPIWEFGGGSCRGEPRRCTGSHLSLSQSCLPARDVTVERRGPTPPPRRDGSRGRVRTSTGARSALEAPLSDDLAVAPQRDADGASPARRCDASSAAASGPAVPWQAYCACGGRASCTKVAGRTPGKRAPRNGEPRAVRPGECGCASVECADENSQSEARQAGIATRRGLRKTPRMNSVESCTPTWSCAHDKLHLFNQSICKASGKSLNNAS